MRKLIYFLIALVLIFGGIAWYFRQQLQDDAIPAAKDFKGEKIMFVFPHPDDEITCSGTLKLFDNQGITTSLITLTKGEAGSSNGMVDERDSLKKKIELGKIRKAELFSVGSLLGVDNQEILDYPDSGLKNIPADSLKKIILERIMKYKPTILFSYDDKVGLYGHIDHRLTAQYVKEIFLENKDKPDFSPKELYQVTLPKPMITFALKISSGFQKNYPKDPAKGLPAPTMAVSITEVGKYKRDAMLLHKTQRPTFNDMQPYFDKISPAIYFRIFDKEYFSEVE